MGQEMTALVASFVAAFLCRLRTFPLAAMCALSLQSQHLFLTLRSLVATKDGLVVCDRYQGVYPEGARVPSSKFKLYFKGQALYN